MCSRLFGFGGCGLQEDGAAKSPSDMPTVLAGQHATDILPEHGSGSALADLEGQNAAERRVHADGHDEGRNGASCASNGHGDLTQCGVDPNPDSNGVAVLGKAVDLPWSKDAYVRIMVLAFPPPCLNSRSHCRPARGVRAGWSYMIVVY